LDTEVIFDEFGAKLAENGWKLGFWGCFGYFGAENVDLSLFFSILGGTTNGKGE